MEVTDTLWNPQIHEVYVKDKMGKTWKSVTASTLGCGSLLISPSFRPFTNFRKFFESVKVRSYLIMFMSPPDTTSLPSKCRHIELLDFRGVSGLPVMLRQPLQIRFPFASNFFWSFAILIHVSLFLVSLPLVSSVSPSLRMSLTSSSHLFLGLPTAL